MHQGTPRGEPPSMLQRMTGIARAMHESYAGSGSQEAMAIDIQMDETVNASMSWRQKVAAMKNRVRKMLKLDRGIAIDSGAADHVMPRGWASMFPVRPSRGSRAGLKYVAAGGHKVDNFGELDFRFTTAEGVSMEWTFQSAG